MLKSIASGLSAPTQSSAGIAANASAPAASYVIGQEFKRRNAEGSLGHLLAHATLGGLTAAAGGNDPLAGALSSGGAEAAAGYISGLFGQKDGSRLSTEQKETVRAITGLIGTAAGAALGSTSADAAQGSLNARNSVENNWLSSRQLIEAEKAYLACGNDEACKQRVIDAARYLSYTQDTSLTSAKLQCLTINSCDNINTLNKQWLDSINIRNVVAELRIHYPNASYQQLISAAQKYAAEADSSFKQGTTRFIVGALTDLPALGLAKQPVSVGTRSIINLLKRRVVSKAPSVNPIIMLQERRGAEVSAVAKTQSVAVPTITQYHLSQRHFLGHLSIPKNTGNTIFIGTRREALEDLNEINKGLAIKQDAYFKTSSGRVWGIHNNSIHPISGKNIVDNISPRAYDIIKIADKGNIEGAVKQFEIMKNNGLLRADQIQKINTMLNFIKDNKR